jgi:hypothetical protein
MTIFGLIFGLLVLLAFFWWVASLAHEFFTSPTERTRFAARPGPMLYALLSLVLLGMLLVGIFIPAIGEITVFSTGGLKFRIWGIGLVGSFAWLLLRWLDGQSNSG